MSWTVPNIRRGRSDSSFVTSPWLWMMRTSPFRANDPVLHVVALAAGECFHHRSHDPRPVFGVNELLISRDGYRAFVRRQAEDAVALLRPVDEPGADVALPVADTRNTLGLFQLALAFSQVAKHQQACQGVGHPSADLPKELLLLRRPGSRIRALVQPEHVRLADLGIDRHSD